MLMTHSRKQATTRDLNTDSRTISPYLRNVAQYHGLSILISDNTYFTPNGPYLYWHKIMFSR